MTPKLLTWISEHSYVGSICGADENKECSFGLAKLQLSRGPRGGLEQRSQTMD